MYAVVPFILFAAGAAMTGQQEDAAEVSLLILLQLFLIFGTALRLRAMVMLRWLECWQFLM
jgi:hypothetical protein